jgi:thiol-disulfide isomerase/thioredoxin
MDHSMKSDQHTHTSDTALIIHPLFMFWSSPTHAFRIVAKKGRGFNLFVLLMLIEFLLSAPVLFSRAALTLSFDARSGLLLFMNGLISYAGRPAMVLVAAGTLLFLICRRSGQNLDLLAAVSVMVHAWIAHTLLIVIASLALYLNWVPWLWPQSPALSHDNPWQISKMILEWGPLVWMFAWAGLSVARRAPEGNNIAPGKSASWPLIFTLTLVAMAGWATTERTLSQWDNVRPLMPGDPLPPIRAHGLNTGEALNTKQYRGKVLLVDFWATWCTPCVASMPHLATLYKELRHDTFYMASINTEPYDQSLVRAFKKEHALPFPIYVDLGQTRKDFQIQLFPSVILADKHGFVRHIITGATSFVSLRHKIDALLKE